MTEKRETLERDSTKNVGPPVNVPFFLSFILDPMIRRSRRTRKGRSFERNFRNLIISTYVYRRRIDPGGRKMSLAHRSRRDGTNRVTGEH